MVVCGLVMRVASKVGESVNEGKLENCSTKRDTIKSLSQGQFAASKTNKKYGVGSKGVWGVRKLSCDERDLGDQFPKSDNYKHIIFLLIIK